MSTQICIDAIFFYVYSPAMKLDPVVGAIKDEMERREWSIQRLADESGVHFTSIYRMFDDDKPAAPNLETLNLLLKALKMRITVTG